MEEGRTSLRHLQRPLSLYIGEKRVLAFPVFRFRDLQLSTARILTFRILFFIQLLLEWYEWYFGAPDKPIFVLSQQ